MCELVFFGIVVVELVLDVGGVGWVLVEGDDYFFELIGFGFVFGIVDYEVVVVGVV